MQSKHQTLERIVELIRTGRKREAIALRKEANFVLGDPDLVEAYQRGSMLHILENPDN